MPLNDEVKAELYQLRNQSFHSQNFSNRLE